ncbi:UNVERIFIED_CONTAM: 4-hydroxybenzoyl-CoA thioesterase [Brevibacillus sp. OAP136]
MLKSENTFKVAWGDTDAAGIVFYPNFYKWMDQATGELFHSIELPLSSLFVHEKIALPLLETHCVFKRPACFEDEIHVETQVLELRDKVFKLEHAFYRGETLLASGYEVRAWTYFGEGSPKAVTIPESVRASLAR